MSSRSAKLGRANLAMRRTAYEALDKSGRQGGGYTRPGSQNPRKPYPKGRVGKRR